MSRMLLFNGGGSRRYPWPRPSRAGFALPEPTFSQQAAVWTDKDNSPGHPGPLVSTLPTDSSLLGFRPDGPDPRWFRERFNGVDIEGIPFCPGNYPQTPTLMQTWFTPWLLTQPGGAKWLDKYIEQYMGVYGLTHPRLSIPQARNMNTPESALIDCARAWASNGAYVSMNTFGGDGPLIDDVNDVGALLDKMKGLLTWLNVCWQADQWFDESDTSSGLCPLDLINYQLWQGLYCERNGLLSSIHWMRDGAWWGDATDSPRAPYSTYTRYGISDRFNYSMALGLPDSASSIGGSYLDRYCQWLGNDHREMSGKKYLHADLMQYDTNAALNNYQEALISVFRATSPTGILVVLSECEAQNQSDQKAFPPRLPVCGDIKGYVGACAEGYGQTTSGFGDGGLFPDGRIL